MLLLPLLYSKSRRLKIRHLYVRKNYTCNLYCIILLGNQFGKKIKKNKN